MIMEERCGLPAPFRGDLVRPGDGGWLAAYHPLRGGKMLVYVNDDPRGF
jgi:hypothetical protein